MRAGSGLDKFASVVLVLCVGIVVSGTKACQTDYEVGVQSKVPTGTATGTPGGTGTSAVTGTVTVTPTGAATGTAAATATAVATATGAATATPDPSITEEEASGGDDLFNELSKLDGDSRLGGKAPAVMAGGSGGVIQPENWLGDAFSKEDDEGSWQDSDGDGFSDSLEEDYGTDPNGAGSAPRSALVTRLAARVGSEAVGDEAPRESGDVTDTDNDGVSDETEEQRGMNPRSMDSDVDGLPDNKELAFGCNPLQIDSDGDGISDGREFDFGADPTIAEPKRGGN